MNEATVNEATVNTCEATEFATRTLRKTEATPAMLRLYAEALLELADSLDDGQPTYPTIEGVPADIVQCAFDVLSSCIDDSGFSINDAVDQAHESALESWDGMTDEAADDLLDALYKSVVSARVR